MANQFQALEVALELAQALRGVLAIIARHDRDLARQLRRAGSSVSSNLSEGSQRSGRDRSQLYRISAGSAAEVHTQLRLAVAWGYVSSEDASGAIALADRCTAMAWRLTHPRR